MPTIRLHDTNGTKSVLDKGDLGYDDYADGGDAGRVWVGNGEENKALAFSDEVTANSTFDRDRVNHTGTQPITTVVEDADYKIMTAAERIKVAELVLLRNNAKLALLDISGTSYSADGDLLEVVYVGDNDTDMYYRDNMTYNEDGDLVTVKHYYGTIEHTDDSWNGKTEITYSNGDIDTTSYTEQ